MKLWLCALLLPLMAGCALMSTSYVEPAEYDLSVPEKPLPEVRFELGTFRNLSGSDRRFLYRESDGKMFSDDYNRWLLSPDLMLERQLHRALSPREEVRTGRKKRPVSAVGRNHLPLRIRPGTEKSRSFRRLYGTGLCGPPPGTDGKSECQHRAADPGEYACGRCCRDVGVRGRIDCRRPRSAARSESGRTESQIKDQNMEHLNVPPANHVKVLDGQGWVGLIDHLGTEATIVNAARVSFGKLKSEMDERDVGLLSYLIAESAHESA